MANSKKYILFIGGDRRNVYLFDRLKALDSVDLHAHGLAVADISHADVETAIARADVVILPMPSIKNGMIPLLSLESAYPFQALTVKMHAGAVLIGGFLEKKPEIPGVEVFDLLKSEQFNQANAWPTAEGAIRVALERTEQTLRGSNCTVLGYGRIGKDLVRLLGSFGANITATARRESQLKEIDAVGAHAVHTYDLLNACKDSHFIFNTIPHVLLDEAILRQLRRDVVIVDLASVPFGVDFNAATRLKLDAQPYQSLPGRMFPRTAADIIFDCTKHLYE